MYQKSSALFSLPNTIIIAKRLDPIAAPDGLRPQAPVLE